MHPSERDSSENKNFSISRRIKSVNYAWRGLGIFIKNSHNSWISIIFGILAIYLGFVLKISSIEWVILLIVIGLVFITEAINTAIEVDIDLTSPEYHPYARDTKDIAAGAVLIAVIISIVAALIIFLPKICVMLK